VITHSGPLDRQFDLLRKPPTLDQKSAIVDIGSFSLPDAASHFISEIGT
jgi:hypothetical protein